MADLASGLTLAPKVRDLFFDNRGQWIPSSWKVMYGGRGGLKTWGFSRVAALLAVTRKTRFMCTRELQVSIRESVHAALCKQIELLNLGYYFQIHEREIRSHIGSEFVFQGLRNQDNSKAKGAEGFDIGWVEEAQSITEDSWQKFTPTIFRNKGAEIWVAFNPDLETDASSQRFIVNRQKGIRWVQTSWRDNPWLPPAMIEDKDYLAKIDPEAYAHVWDGAFRTKSKAQVLFGKISIEDFDLPKDSEPQWDGPYYGIDFGYSADPSTMVRLWVSGRVLYVEQEAYGIGIEIDNLPQLFSTVTDAAMHVSRADSARPETISYLSRHGFPRVVAALKGPGSVEDGVEHLRSYEKIVIHPLCKHAIEESRLWSYKVDAKSGNVLPVLIDKHDHIWDAARYALEPLIRAQRAATSEPLLI